VFYSKPEAKTIFYAGFKLLFSSENLVLLTISYWQT